MRIRKRLAGVAAIAAVALLAGCFGGKSDSGGDKTEDKTQDAAVNLPTDGPVQEGGILTVNDASDAPTLDPHKSATAYTHAAISGIVYSKLLEFKVGRDIPYGSMGVRGDLAETWSKNDDGTVWTFNLHKGVKWQDVAPVSGREFTSADVVCTVNRIKTLPGVQTNLMAPVTTVDTPDPYTVVFNLNAPYAAFDETMASFYMEILPCEGTSGQFDLATTAIGTGPFILKDWQRKQQRTYVKNPTYFVKGKPHLDEVHIVVMSDPASAIAAVRTGELDVTGSVNDQLLPSLTGSNPDVAYRYQLGLTMNFVFMNQAQKPFDDLRVRKAIAMAWDRKGMNDSFYAGGYALAGPFPSTLFGGMTPEESEKLIPYDPEGAKKLLAEAGYPNGFDVEMLTTDGYGPNITNQAQWVQEDLKKIGINTTLKILDYATYFTTFQAEDYSIGYGLSTGFLTADEWLQTTYASKGPRNWFNSGDPKLDAMIAEQSGILDKDERENKLQEISTYIETNVLDPVMGSQYTGILVQQPWVHNLYTHPQYARPYMADVWIDENAPGRK